MSETFNCPSFADPKKEKTVSGFRLQDMALEFDNFSLSLPTKIQARVEKT